MMLDSLTPRCVHGKMGNHQTALGRSFDGLISPDRHLKLGGGASFETYNSCGKGATNPPETWMDKIGTPQGATTTAATILQP